MVNFKFSRKNNKKIDLEKEALMDEKQKNQDEIKQEKNTESMPQKINIKRYKDPEGLTVGKMAIGLWLVEHRKHLIMIPIVLLIFVSAITWIYTLYCLGFYIGWGMKEDQKSVSDLLRPNLAGHDFVLSRSAQDLQFQPVQIIELDNKKYDFLVRYKNPNKKFWAKFEYYFKVGDIEFDHGSAFILPGETKYLLALAKELVGQPTGVKFHINNLNWARINLHKYPDWEKFYNEHLDIAISNIKFTPAKATILTEKLNLNDLHFTADNNTAYNYYGVNFIILLYNRGKVIGASKYILNNFMSGQIREIKVTWPGRLGRVDDIEITPEINITRDDIYIKFEGGAGEKK